MFGFGSPKKKKGGDKDKRSKEKVNEIQSTAPVTSDDKKMLKGRHTPKQASGQFYFVQKDPGRTDSVRDSGDNTETIELNRNAVQAIGAAASTNTNDNKAVAAVAADSLYEPKAVNRNLVKGMSLMKNESTRMGSLTSSSIQTKQKPTMNPLSTIFFKVFGNPSKKNTINDADVKKINQKLFLGNERTFLKWMYVSVWTTGAAIGLSAVAPSSSSTAVATNSVYGSNFQAYSSLLFTGISIIICTYAMVQFAKRTLLIVKRSPSGYEDRYGPVIIGAMFVLAFTAQYCIMMAQFTR